jgi:hypothetical protein
MFCGRHKQECFTSKLYAKPMKWYLAKELYGQHTISLTLLVALTLSVVYIPYLRILQTAKCFIRSHASIYSPAKYSQQQPITYEALKIQTTNTD